ncbi:ribosome biogenesis GTPase Der [Candidatus Saccharibacteria bacterium CG10_big_fil_rev_8_21_14_0_10_47_8]|nr:MAG: ribosome biogenesis GTPase Der [Candidatus Saccharibacteria bacterium CG10_big_fil_rev_8_21_14_0_10_47_8]
MSSEKVPIVAIVGRANVGKSSIFNAIIGRREAIVADEPGTTRDSITGRASWNSKDFWLVDTAGLKKAADSFELTIQEQIAQAADAADIIIVVTEADVPPLDEDRKVAKLALKSKKPVILVVNKIDKNKSTDLNQWLTLGIKPVLATSVTQKIGFEELLDDLVAILPKARIKQAKNRLRLAILGRPNVGKSALFNTLSKKQQAIVADRAGTTRDVNRITVRYQQIEIELMDTAGIRRSGKIERGVEHFSVLRSLAAIEEADICLLLLDSAELNVALDQKIAGLVKEAGRGLVLVVSKWDSVDKDAYTRDLLVPQIASNFAFVPWAPLIFTSSVTGQNVTKIFDLVLDIAASRAQTIKTTELNRWLRRAVDIHPPAGLKNRQPKLNYIVQETDNPIPSFKVFGSHTKFLHWSYKRYMERSFREQWPYSGSAIKFWFIEKH